MRLTMTEQLRAARRSGDKTGKDMKKETTCRVIMEFSAGDTVSGIIRGMSLARVRDVVKSHAECRHCDTRWTIECDGKIYKGQLIQK